MPLSPGSDPPRRLLARELALGFGAVSIVAVVTCGLLLALIEQVSGLVTGMREEEAAIRQGLELAAAVREQYVQVTQALIGGEPGTPDRYGEWRDRVREGLAGIAPWVPVEDRPRLRELERLTRALDARFAGETRAALVSGDRERLRAEHRALAPMAAAASLQADALAEVVSSRMVHSHVLATRATRLGLLVGGAGALAVVALSVAFTLRLRRAVLRPLTLLTAAARRFGAGDFSARAGRVGRGELQAVAQAFDRMAEELAERERRLVHHERMAAIGSLAAGVAHELNNPIGVIRGYLATMDARGDTATLEEELQILDEEASHCQRIAEDLLAYSRPLELRPETLDLGAFLDETVRRFRETPAARQADVQVEAAPCTVRADATRLRQVVWNLVLNAVQVSPQGARVTVLGRPAGGGGCTITVADRGPGIPLDEQGRIFEPFYSRRRGGSGLGLAVCQGIVHGHGGSISVESREGQGATFRLALPAAPSGGTASATAAPGLPPPAIAPGSAS